MFDLPEGGEAPGWETPDPDFYQPSYTIAEQNFVVDFELISEQDDEPSHKTPTP